MSCAVCGAPAPAPFRAPPAELAPDLDQRPGEPARSTLPRWVATCRSCGAAGPDLAALPAVAGQVVGSAAYQALDGPGRPFLRWAMIAEAAGDRAAAEAVLQAAWMLDDAGLDASALRRRAVALFGPPDGPGAALRRVDLLRRAGDFTAAAQAAAPGGAVDENSAAILAFQRDRIAARDSGRHMISSALRPPARRPHVTHGTARARGFWARGFWGRLFGP